jgi:LmbE family N-acetylglucosaminyl deacetylase
MPTGVSSLQEHEMNFRLSSAETFVPDGLMEEQALRRTTHLAISAHQDDLEIMATGAILQCYQRHDRWFSGVVMTDGRGSPRDGIYADFTDETMRQVRISEQKKAAMIGEYASLVLLDYPSKTIKDGSNPEPSEDLEKILRVARPSHVYTHNLADKHDTHVATAIHVVAAIRRLPEDERPEKLYGCEVWRDLDWMVDGDKVTFDLSSHENLQAALLGVYDSQISGGKRYDLASMGRRRANATYYESHGVDVSSALSYAMDLTPLIRTPEKDILDFVQEHIQHFAHDVADRLTRLGQ